MKRLVVVPSNLRQHECLKDSRARGEHPLSFDPSEYSVWEIKEWLYAAQGLVVYANPSWAAESDKLIDFAIQLGLSVEHRSLDGKTQDNQDSTGA